MQGIASLSTGRLDWLVRLSTSNQEGVTLCKENVLLCPHLWTQSANGLLALRYLEKEGGQEPNVAFSGCHVELISLTHYLTSSFFIEFAHNDLDPLGLQILQVLLSKKAAISLNCRHTLVPSAITSSEELLMILRVATNVILLLSAWSCNVAM